MRAETSLWIWPFELEEKIGEGGMGVVYRGRYVKNDLRVAVKLIPEEVADKTILARFEREVDLLKNLRHPNIVHSFGGVCEDKRRFYAMELVDGGSLDTLLKSRGGSLPWEKAVEYALQMCAALQYAHEKKIVHRDVKPANFLLTKEGKLKLSDFGLAIVASGNKLTASGKTVGSFRYMAPEQIRGKPETVAQTDLYALGCVLFQMIVGEPPFDGTNAGELLNRHLSEPPRRVAQLIPETPARLDELIDSLLSKDLNDRPPSAANVAATLQAVSLTPHLGGPTLPTEPAPSKNEKRRPTVKSTSPKPTGGGISLWTIILGLLAVALGLYANALRNENRELKKAETLWIEEFKTNQNNSRPVAAVALGKLAKTSDRAYETLTNGLDSTDPVIREWAAAGLAETGGRAKPMLPKLISMQKSDDNSLVRSRVNSALSSVRNGEAPAETSWLGWTIALGVLCAIAAAGYIVYQRRTQSPA